MDLAKNKAHWNTICCVIFIKRTSNFPKKIVTTKVKYYDESTFKVITFVNFFVKKYLNSIKSHSVLQYSIWGNYFNYDLIKWVLSEIELFLKKNWNAWKHKHFSPFSDKDDFW